MINENKIEVCEDVMIQSNTFKILSKIKKVLIIQWNDDKGLKI